MRSQPAAETTHRKTRSTISRKLALATAILAMLAQADSAYASLGGTADTVEADRASMQASRHITQTGSHAVHELRAPNGVVVKEFVSATGVVFAVTWQGPVRPNLQQLLGGYFAKFHQAAREQAQRGSVRRMLKIEEPELIVHSGGHPRAFVGRAYVPQLIPAGVQPEEIR